MDDDQQFCLRWNNHQSTLVSVFDTLLEKGIHVDCTLAAEGQMLKAHKVVLSACSPYFENVLSQQFDKHPIIILKDVKYAELRAMMDYMYRGEVNISQDQLAALLKAAESLQIKGLSDNKPSRPPSRPAPPPPAAAPLPAPLAHPPRAISPPPQVRDGSVDSRDGSESPTRRRKKARRLSTEGVPPVVTEPQGNGEEPQCKEETTRDGVEDLTIDEEADDPPQQTHNDVVRNFQWHMERSQDEIMNSSDGVRDSQDGKGERQSIVTRSKKSAEPTESEKITTLAVLKTVKSSKLTPAQLLAQAINKEKELALPPILKEKEKPAAEDTKENKSTPKVSPRSAPMTPMASNPDEARARFQIFSSRSRQPPCAQYKTEKGYKCPNCQRCYNARKNLVRHVTLECGIEPQYKCPHCSFRKHRRNELKKHMERKHPEHAPAPSPSPSGPRSPATTPPLAVK